MAILNFPANPSVDDTYEENGVLYVWDGTKWTANTSANFLPITGGTLTGDLTVPSLNGGPLAGFRNQIINGDFRVAQRGTTTALGSGVGQFVADRWFVTGPGRTGNATVEDGRVAGIPCLNLPTIFTGDVFLNTTIELPGAGSPGPFQNGSTWTLSVWSEEDLSGQSPFAVFREGGEVSTNQVGAGTFGAFAATGATAIGSFNQYSASLSITASPGATNICLYVGFPVSNGQRYSQIQLEPGPVATPFEHRPIGTELALCQRYFEVINLCEGEDGSNYVATVGIMNSGGSIAYFDKSFKVQKRAVPTVANGSTVNGKLYSGTTADITSYKPHFPSKNGVAFAVGPSSTFKSGLPVGVFTSAMSVSCDAEL
jgi:hypothetical protein